VKIDVKMPLFFYLIGKNWAFLRRSLNLFSIKLFLSVVMRNLILVGIIVVFFLTFISRFNTNVNAATCGISASPDINFGNLDPGDTSSDYTTSVTNTGTDATTSLSIEGTDWSSGLNTMDVTQTHWSLSDDPYGSMDDLNLSPGETLGTNISPQSSVTVHFKLHVELNQVSGTYTQTITFTASC